MLALLGLLLVGAEPSSYGFLNAGRTLSTLDGDNSRAYATNVVHHHGNDSNTMHNHEVPPTRMEHHATRIELSVPELTSPLHVAQCEKVHPRDPISLRDNDKNNHAAGAICTSDDQHADLSGIRTDTNHAVLMSRRQSAKTHTGGPPVAWLILRHITVEYQYFVHKPPSPTKSRRRNRYDERLAYLTARGGRVRKRRRLGPPGTTDPPGTVNHNQPPVMSQQKHLFRFSPPPSTSSIRYWSRSTCPG